MAKSRASKIASSTKSRSASKLRKPIRRPAPKHASKSGNSLIQTKGRPTRSDQRGRQGHRPAGEKVGSMPEKNVPRSAPVPVIPAGRARKNLAGLQARDLEHFRHLLLSKRGELLGDMSFMEREALRGTGASNLSNLPMHMADMGTDNYEQEFTLGLVEKDRVLLREINAALGKIQDGSYGICEGTGKPIGKPRLEAQPWARHSIEYARKLEKGLIR